MDETDKIFTSVEKNSSSNGFDSVNSSSVCQEYNNSKNCKFRESNSDMDTENLVSFNGFKNDQCSTIPPPATLEATPRPIISVRRTKDLFGKVDAPDSRRGAHPEFDIEDFTIDPVQQTNSAADILITHSALPQLDASVRTIGSDVIAYPVAPMSGLISQAENGSELKVKRTDVGLPSNIKLPSAITVIKRTPPRPMKKSIADMLANRGVTVSNVEPGSRKVNPIVSFQKANTSQSVLHTVDLTKDSDNPRRSGSRMNRRTRGRFTCQICDKVFTSAFDLTQHMSLHRVKRVECKECTAQYPTEAALEAHRQQYHPVAPDLAIPIVDLRQGGVLSKLEGLGIRCVIPLAQLHGGSGGGAFGLPVVPVGAASNPAICDIGLLGASNVFPIGTLKPINFN